MHKWNKAHKLSSTICLFSNTNTHSSFLPQLRPWDWTRSCLSLAHRPPNGLTLGMCVCTWSAANPVYLNNNNHNKTSSLHFLCSTVFSWTSFWQCKFPLLPFSNTLNCLHHFTSFENPGDELLCVNKSSLPWQDSKLYPLMKPHDMVESSTILAQFGMESVPNFKSY